MGKYISDEFWMGLLKKENKLELARMRTSSNCDAKVNTVALFATNLEYTIIP